MDIARYIDYTNLKQEATKEDIVKLCQRAKEEKYYSVCVNPSYVSLAKKQLEGSDVKVAAVIGFPLGQNVPAIKAAEAAVCVSDGADELDMVINVGALKDGLTNFVLEDIKGVVNAGVPVKVILETAKLTDSEIALAIELAVKAGAAFIKTSTGFMGEGATEHAVAYMVKCAAGRIKVKASGGIRTVEAAKEYIKLGAERIGASNLS